METIKRYSLQELTDKLEELCFEDLANSTVRWENGTQADSGRSFLRMDLEEGLTNCVIYRDRIEAFIEKSVDKSLNKEQRTIYAKAVELLYKLSDDEELTTYEIMIMLYCRATELMSYKYLVKNLLKKYKFKKVTIPVAIYNKDLEFYQQAMQYRITVDVNLGHIDEEEEIT